MRTLADLRHLLLLSSQHLDISAKLRSGLGFRDLYQIFQYKDSVQLTPCNSACDPNKVRCTSTKHDDKKLIHLDCLHQHPNHGCQQEEMREESEGYTNGSGVATVDTDDEQQVEE